MSKLDESPALRFKRGFDVNVVIPTTRLEGFVRINNRDQKLVIESEVEDDALRGPVEGRLSLKAGYDQDCERLELVDQDYFATIRQVLRGRAKLAYRRVISNAFWSQNANRVDANRIRFWQDVCKDLATEQTDVRGVVLEHMKKETSLRIPMITWPDSGRSR